MSDTTRSGDDEKNVSNILKGHEKDRRKKKRRIIGGVLAVFVLVVWYALQPLVAGPVYGVCRTYLETYVKYPTSLKIVEYSEYGRSMWIFYSYTDEFGGSRSERIECISAPDMSAGYALEDIKINRKSIDPEELARFNSAIPGILAASPDLRIPPPTKGGLEGLRRD